MKHARVAFVMCRVLSFDLGARNLLFRNRLAECSTLFNSIWFVDRDHWRATSPFMVFATRALQANYFKGACLPVNTLPVMVNTFFISSANLYDR